MAAVHFYFISDLQVGQIMNKQLKAGCLNLNLACIMLPDLVVCLWITLLNRHGYG